ncbi:hypothetical protein [Mycobacterium camsae]|uniref:hypothetical protein n=1 Tax=Mycobacterium gordonae TaxID=1778 RepID=UPI00197F9C17|nr:hypothetical protein [Mycobacterium gordonae]
MGVVDRTVRGMGRTVSRAATATTSAAGAVGGAAVNGIVGGVKGAAEGIQQGLSTGSRSTPAAALAIGAIGAAGLVEWPILLAVGGGALLLRKLNHPPEAPVQAVQPVKAKLAPVPDEPPAKKAPAKAAAKKAAGRRAGAGDLRSTN